MLSDATFSKIYPFAADGKNHEVVDKFFNTFVFLHLPLIG